MPFRSFSRIFKAELFSFSAKAKEDFMNIRLKAALTAALMILTVFLPIFSQTAYAVEADGSDTEFARSIINNGAGAPDRFLSSAYPKYESILLSHTEAITAGASDLYEAALKLYDWMVFNVKYTYGHFGVESISDIFEKKIGSCTDFSYAYMAWLRYQGIRAWCASGSYYSGSYRWDHTWCVAELGGVEYVFDPEVQNYNYVRNGVVSHTKFCVNPEKAAANYVGSSARYFNYDNGDKENTAVEYKSPAPKENPAYSTAPENTVEVPVDPEVVYGLSVWDILTEEDFLEIEAPAPFEEATTFTPPPAVPAPALDSVPVPAPAPVISAAPSHMSFEDVPLNYEFIDGIDFVSHLKLMNGTGENTFEPEGYITRGMLVTVLGRLAQINPDDYLAIDGGWIKFADVSAESWYSPYIGWAAKSGIVLGYSDGSFKPDAVVTHQQFYVVMQRYMVANLLKFSSIYADGNSIYPDFDQVDSWAQDAALLCGAADIIPSTDGRLNPFSVLSRGELAHSIMKYCVFAERLQN